MPFDDDAIPVDVPPGVDELEVSVFGPGFGESIAVHLPGGRWFSWTAAGTARRLPPRWATCADSGSTQPWR